MKIYTKKGDLGITYLLDGKEVSKSNLIVIGYGAIDKVNVFIGSVVSCKNIPNQYKLLIYEIMKSLFAVSASLSIKSKNKNKIIDNIVKNIDEEIIIKIEDIIDNLEKKLPVLKKFILPIGCDISIKCHLARTEIRIAEEIIVALKEKKIYINSIVLKYFNRLSDLFFVFARYFNFLYYEDEVFIDF